MTTPYWTVAGALAALVWLVAGGGAAAVGAALLITTAPPAPTTEGIVVGGGALVLVPAALALDEPAAAVALMAALAVLRVALAVRNHADRRLPALAAVGAALPALALLTVQADEGVWQLPGDDPFPAALALAGAAAVVVASALPGAPAWTRVLVVPALVLGVPAAHELPVAVLAGAGALLAAWLGLPVLALAALAFVPVSLPAAWLLAAAAVLAAPLADRGPVVGLLGLPGAAALAAAIVAGPLTFTGAVAAVALAGTAVLLGRHDLSVDRDVPMPLWPVLAAAAWLLLAPATWDWVGDARIDHWDAGALLAAVAAAGTVAVRR